MIHLALSSTGWRGSMLSSTSHCQFWLRHSDGHGHAHWHHGGLHRLHGLHGLHSLHGLHGLHRLRRRLRCQRCRQLLALLFILIFILIFRLILAKSQQVEGGKQVQRNAQGDEHPGDKRQSPYVGIVIFVHDDILCAGGEGALEGVLDALPEAGEGRAVEAEGVLGVVQHHHMHRLAVESDARRQGGRVRKGVREGIAAVGLSFGKCQQAQCG
mmetsp:Transcript_33691/g.80820  ORF Transcript_33691/g.80820 Transcript_33691/m.80820 type:complete len:213 (+) Transcript_33691:222-860(+)